MHEFPVEALGNPPAPSAITPLKVAENFLMPYVPCEESSGDSDEDASDPSDQGEGDASDEDAGDSDDEGQNEDSDEGEGDSDGRDEGEGESDDSDEARVTVMTATCCSERTAVAATFPTPVTAEAAQVPPARTSVEAARVTTPVDDADQSELAAGATETET